DGHRPGCGSAPCARRPTPPRARRTQRRCRASGERRIAAESRSVNMTATPFPTRPGDVVALSVHEFTSGIDRQAEPPIARVCEWYLDDANRALVWLIRFRALTAWCTGAETRAWLASGETRYRRACEVAAGFT